MSINENLDTITHAFQIASNLGIDRKTLKEFDFKKYHYQILNFVILTKKGRQRRDYQKQAYQTSKRLNQT